MLKNALFALYRRSKNVEKCLGRFVSPEGVNGF